MPCKIRDEHLYRQLYRIRRVEEEIIRLYPSDSIKSPVHLSIGQESVAVGICSALAESDVVFGTYRGHALYLAKGGDLKSMMAELYGKSSGSARGKAGSMHLVDTAVGMMGTSAIVATTIPQAVGYALAVQMRGEKTAVVVFFGDGATDEGVYAESLNLRRETPDPVCLREQRLCHLLFGRKPHAGRQFLRTSGELSHSCRPY